MIHSLSPFFKKYKFIDSKTYSSTDWLFDNKKNYRQVFDRYEIDYVYLEISFHNKLFDIRNWNASFKLVCYSQEDNGNEKICTLDFERTIYKEDHIFYLREGWGNEERGAFWTEGAYCWEAYIDGKNIATTFFFIQESKKEYPSTSSYIQLESANLYKASSEDIQEENPIYQKTFARYETPYICTNLIFKNIQVQKDWYCEIFVLFYNGYRKLKGETKILHRANLGDEKINLTFHWGSDEKGSWFEDDYTIEVVFLDTLVAVIPFKVSTSSTEEGHAEIISPSHYREYNPARFPFTKKQWIQNLAQSKTNIVINELLDFTTKYELTELTKETVNLSSQVHRLNKLEVNNKDSISEFNQINESLIDLINKIRF